MYQTCFKVYIKLPPPLIIFLRSLGCALKLMMHFIGWARERGNFNHKLSSGLVVPVISLITPRTTSMFALESGGLFGQDVKELKFRPKSLHMTHDQNLLAAYGLEMHSVCANICGGCTQMC